MKLVKAIELQTNYCTGYTDIWVKRKCGVVYYPLSGGESKLDVVRQYGIH